ncbi:MAG: hypothetical protein QF805_07710, partial [Pirellulaceae bacterium]|nr:hypothetical protein [Pirellulaceae bacterium]
APGMPHVVGALGHPRDPVALAARQAIRRRVQSWRLIQPQDISRQVAALAHHLAEVSPTLGGNGRAFTAELADDLLKFGLDREAVDVAQVLSDCERVIASGRDGQPISRTAHRANPLQLYRQLTADEPIGSEPVIQIDPAIGGAAEPIELPAAPESIGPPGPAEPRVLPPGRFAPDSPAPLSMTTSPPAASSGAAPDDGNWSVQVRGLVDTEVMRLLQHQQTDVAIAAVNELRRRGYRAAHLRLAKRMTSVDANERRELASELPQWSGIDVRPWLIALSRDEDPSVRGVAAAIIASSTDPYYRKRVAQMIAEETDEKVLANLRPSDP